MRIVLVFCLMLFSCGTYDPKEEISDSKPNSKWQAIKSLVKAECGRCHNGTKHPLDFNLEPVWANSKSKTRLSNGSMPPDKKLEDSQKEVLLSYFL